MPVLDHMSGHESQECIAVKGFNSQHSELHLAPDLTSSESAEGVSRFLVMYLLRLLSRRCLPAA